MPRTATAAEDPSIHARIVRRTPLLYADGADPALDRPGHVRAASGLVRVGGTLAVIQDDASFVALVETATGRVRAVPLPAGPDGKRQFDDPRGNKRHKLDLEAVVPLRDEPGGAIAAFGSGSAPPREVVVFVRGVETASPAVEVVPAAAFYAVLREAADFAGSELNVEGAVLDGDCLRLFGRGNGAARGEVLPVDAVCRLHWPSLRAHLRDPARFSPPAPDSVVRYELGMVDGLRLGFTDAARERGATFFAASAEDSPDATRDGRVAGSALGVFAPDGHARWTLLRGEDGAPFDGKVEGLEVAAEGPLRARVVVDRDDPDAPAEMCEVELSGAW